MAKVKTVKKIVLFDAHAIIHRAYHAMPDFSSSKGEPTGGLYGVSTMLMRIIGELKPDYLVACYDRAETTFRKQVYENYKANRPKTEEVLIAQLIRSRDIFTAFGIPIFDSAGFEADDIIGTLVEQLKKETCPTSSRREDLQIIIASGDMDTLQLVKDNKVVVYTLKKGLNDTVTYDEKAVFERYGFAPALVADYKGLRGDPSDNIMGVAGIGEKTATTLIQEFGSIENIYKQIKKNEKVLIEKGIKPRIIELLKNNEEEANFSKTLATIRHDAPVEFSLPDDNWQNNFDLAKVEKLFNELDFRSLIGRAKNLISVPVAKQGELLSENKVVSDEKIDEFELQKTAIALWLVNSDKVSPDLEDIKNFAGTEKFNEAQTKIMAELDKRGLRGVYENIELPLISILARAKERGILIDTAYLKKLSKDYHQKLTKIENQIYELVGETFNLNSPKQLGEIIFDKLQLTVKGFKKTAGGARSTKESELQKLKGAHPVIDLILDYRELQKLLSTYIDNLPAMLGDDGALHSTLNQAGTTTGRMSSSNPNLQNIPAREGLGMAIRQAFVSRTGFKFLAFDYSQIELRVLAALSQDSDLVKIFKEDKDIHSSVASRVFGVPESEVTKEMRRKAKVINFGIIYGMGVNALKANLGTTRDEAQKFYDNYFATFPTIKKYFDDVVAEAKKTGYTETLFGRRRYIEALKSYLPQIRAGAERMAMNAPLQGTAADIIKMAMIKADQDLNKTGLNSDISLLLQVHDELIYEVKDGAEEKAEKIIKQAMENAVEFPVPIRVSFKQGKSWGDLD